MYGTIYCEMNSYWFYIVKGLADKWVEPLVKPVSKSGKQEDTYKDSSGEKFSRKKEEKIVGEKDLDGRRLIGIA